MASIKITQFGGIAPSVDPRKLPADGAQVAENLDLRFGDFRPTKGLGASVATVPLGTRSIFRTPSGAWLSSLTDTHWVNGQIPDAESERVYLTGRSAYPEAWQASSYRRLGVPAPDTKPTTVVQVTDEFDQTDADAAQQEATAAVIAAVHATDTPALLGNAAPTGVGSSPLVPDPLYPKVQLHLQFTALSGGTFTDSSPQKRPITKESGIALGADNLGPLGVPGTGYADLSGGGGSTNGLRFPEIRRWRDEADPTWCFDASVISDVDLEYIDLQCRDGNLREITFLKPGGDWVVLAGNDKGGSFSTQLRAKRADGSYVCPAGQKVHVRVQNTGVNLEAYIDGVLVGTTPNPEGLELSILGRSNRPSRPADYAWQGSFDEVRVTFASRGSANFTPPTLPYSTAAVPSGFWVAHGDPAAVGLPTLTDADAAYLIELSLTGGIYTATNPADDYLRSGVLGGAQVTYSGGQHWAVPVIGYRGAGFSIVESALESALAAIDNPASPGTPLLDSTQSATLADLIADVYDPTISPLLALVTAVNARQADVQAALAARVPTADLDTAIGLLESASTAIVDYFAALDAKVKVILTENESEIFGSITNAVIARDVQTRTYIVTYLTDWFEESSNSPASDLLSVDQNDSITVTAPAAPSDRHIIGWRLYRSATSSTGAAWALVVDADAPNALMVNGEFMGFSIGNRVYTDGQPDEKLQEQCESLTWAEPPENLEGLVGLPNGIMAGFFGKTLCFSVPFRPHAWPVEYQRTLQHDIVGIGVVGQTAVVLTKGFPVYVSGADSAQMSEQIMEVPQACIAPRSIATVDGGVVYASPDGLCLASASGIAVLTQGAFSKEDWQAAVTPTAVGAFHDGAYYIFTD
ncbi:MAG TPA: hypothetical protein VGE36_13805 [Roseateles sp.]